MSFSVRRTWDNRPDKVVINPATGRSWTRRIQWLVWDGSVKLKLEDGKDYREVLTDKLSGNIIWKRFREGQSIDDCVSILGNVVPASLQSKKASECAKQD